MNKNIPNEKENSKESELMLPEFDVDKNLPLRVVTKSVSVTFIILLIVVSLTGIIIFTVEMDVTVNANGFLEASNVSRLHSPESGVINRVFIYSGDTVQVNQKIAEIDSTELRERLLQIKSELALKKNSYNRLKQNINYSVRENEIQLSKAKSQLIRAKASFRDRLFDFFPNDDPDSVFENYIPGEHINLDFAMAEVNIALSEIDNQVLKSEMIALNEYELKELEISINKLSEEKKINDEKLKNLVIRSPVDGIILSEGVDRLVGEYFSKGTLLLEISIVDDWNATLFVQENEIHKIKLRDRVKVEIIALKSKRDIELLNATVKSVAAESISNKDVKYANFAGFYRVSVKFDENSENNLFLDLFKHGYSVKANIITRSGKIAQLIYDYITENL